MITIVYPFRNRELERVKRSLDSLCLQSNLEFKVVFIDYGSDIRIANQVKELLKDYSFVDYKYLFTQNQPWNKSKAINFALSEINSSFCFVADIDIIFHFQFIDTIIKELQLQQGKLLFFQVGYLSDAQTKNFSVFERVKNFKASSPEATGMTLFNTEGLKAIGGFDEFFHFWGAEDADVHNRLQLAGYDIQFYNQEVLLLHQWHPSYRSGEKDSLTKELQCSGIVQLNQEHLTRNKMERRIVKQTEFGKTISKEDFELLNSDISSVRIQNKVWEVDHFLYFTLPNLKKGLYQFDFVEDEFLNSFKYKIKKIFGKKVPKYYSLKQINDFLLQHIIGFYHQNPYQLLVADDLQKITFKILKEA